MDHYITTKINPSQILKNTVELTTTWYTKSHKNRWTNFANRLVIPPSDKRKKAVGKKNALLLKTSETIIWVWGAQSGRSMCLWQRSWKQMWKLKTIRGKLLILLATGMTSYTWNLTWTSYHVEMLWCQFRINDFYILAK